MESNDDEGSFWDQVHFGPGDARADRLHFGTVEKREAEGSWFEIHFFEYNGSIELFKLSDIGIKWEEVEIFGYTLFEYPLVKIPIVTINGTFTPVRTRLELEFELGGSEEEWGLQRRTIKGEFMPQAARVGDLTSHLSFLGPGMGSDNVKIGGKPAWRECIDVHICPQVKPQPHGTGKVAHGEQKVLINGYPACKVGHILVEDGGGANAIAFGCPTVWIGEPITTVTVDEPVITKEGSEPWYRFYFLNETRYFETEGSWSLDLLLNPAVLLGGVAGALGELLGGGHRLEANGQVKGQVIKQTFKYKAQWRIPWTDQWIGPDTDWSFELGEYDYSDIKSIADMLKKHQGNAGSMLRDEITSRALELLDDRASEKVIEHGKSELKRSIKEYLLSEPET